MEPRDTVTGFADGGTPARTDPPPRWPAPSEADDSFGTKWPMTKMSSAIGRVALDELAAARKVMAEAAS